MNNKYLGKYQIIVKFKLGNDPTYTLEHAFRHLEVLCGDYEMGKIDNYEYHAMRSQLKKQVSKQLLKDFSTKSAQTKQTKEEDTNNE